MNLSKLIFRWLPVVARAAAVYVLFSPMLSKFTNTERMVGLFGNLGLPAPEITVLFVGVVELLGVVLYALGLGGRVIAVPLIIEMIVAMSTAGVNQNNIIVLTASVIILTLGTGALSPFQPEGSFLGRFRYRVQGESNGSPAASAA